MTGQDRLTRPLIRRHGELVETDWDTAMSLIVDRSRELLQERGPLSHGFYTTGQLFLEEYYALSVLGKAGIGTPHMDGNTRLCTATAAAAMKESFGSDGQPGTYADLDHCDALFLFGHNMAETQTVLWSRVLDRLSGPRPPAVVCVDPRRTEVARHSQVHLAVRPGTNLPLMNGLMRELLTHGWLDQKYLAAHTIGVDELEAAVDRWTPKAVADVCRIEASAVRQAAEIFGTSSAVVSTVLQGFYQSHQATAAACQVNNLHLLRGMLGRPGCGVLQMNGQPTAQNTRECGADGDLPGFRNWDNPRHVEELAELWNVDPLVIPHWAPPTHAMQIFRYAEQGSIELLWVSGTNPAVSMPDLGRIRTILGSDSLFLVVQDLYLTETARLADVVLPAAGWGEKTGCFTNVDRTVHLSRQAVQPPGEARSDLDIFLDYARRMDFRDRDGAPLLGWDGSEEAFRAWQECSRGRPCDYTGLSYQRLSGDSGIQWPCTDERPEGTARLYGDGHFPTDPDYCEDYGRDLLTGASVEPADYRARGVAGRAVLKAAHYYPAAEEPDDDYPWEFTTGRTAYHFHTRTKTARTPVLNRAAPGPWVEMSFTDADPLGLAEGDIAEVRSRRGCIVVPVRISDMRPGTVFAPFHFGYFDSAGSAGDDQEQPGAANELTLTEWDPVSKQPGFKNATVAVRKVRTGSGPAPAPTTTASRPVSGTLLRATVGGTAAEASETVVGPVELPEPTRARS